MYVCMYIYIYIYIYIERERERERDVYTHIPRASRATPRIRRRAPPSARGHSSRHLYSNIIFRDGQTYPKRFLPELNETQ